MHRLILEASKLVHFDDVVEWFSKRFENHAEVVVMVKWMLISHNAFLIVFISAVDCFNDISFGFCWFYEFLNWADYLKIMKNSLLLLRRAYFYIRLGRLVQMFHLLTILRSYIFHLKAIQFEICSARFEQRQSTEAITWILQRRSPIGKNISFLLNAFCSCMSPFF